MKYKAVPIVLSVIIVLSMAIVACGGTPVFELSNLQITKDPLYVGEVQTISVDVSNTGGAGGTCTVNFSVNGEELPPVEVMVDPDDEETASLLYTPQSAGDYTVTVDDLSDSFTVRELVACDTAETPVDQDDDWWWYDYVVTNGNVLVSYAMYDATLSTIDCLAEQSEAPEDRICTVEFPSTEMRIGFSKEVTDNVSRQVRIEGESFVSDLFQVLFAANWTDITLKLGEREGGQFSYQDAIGTLYVADGDGDVDVVVTDEADEDSNDRSYTLSGGHEAGDMIGDFPLYAAAEAQEQDILIGMPTMMTTGHAYNDVIKTMATCPAAGCKINGHNAEVDGAKFCDGGGATVAPYVGTNGSLAIVATALKQKFIGINLDFQMVLTVDISPK
jgi:hypothetical protein